MATGGKSYAIREADTENRLGKVWKTYPYSLRSLLEALDDARLRSINAGPQIVTVVQGRRSQVIHRYEHGEEAWSASTAELLSEHGNDTQG